MDKKNFNTFMLKFCAGFFSLLEKIKVENQWKCLRETEKMPLFCRFYPSDF